MEHYEQPTFHDIELSELTSTVAKLKEEGYGFVQLCATTLDDACEMLYAFTEPGRKNPGLVGYNVIVPDGTSVPSITKWYPAAFIFENETHDLFGIHIEGINIDYEGDFYQLSVAYPMNPRAAVSKEGAAQSGEEEADNE